MTKPKQRVAYRVMNRLSGEVMGTYPTARQAKHIADMLNRKLHMFTGWRPIYYVSKRKP